MKVWYEIFSNQTQSKERNGRARREAAEGLNTRCFSLTKWKHCSLQFCCFLLHPPPSPHPRPFYIALKNIQKLLPSQHQFSRNKRFLVMFSQFFLIFLFFCLEYIYLFASEMKSYWDPRIYLAAFISCRIIYPSRSCRFLQFGMFY